jgi:hypothetical protein
MANEVKRENAFLFLADTASYIVKAANGFVS